MIQRVWQLQDAKNKFSELVDEALAHGPQVVTRHGVETVVVISYSDYHKRRIGQKKPYQFFQESPLVGVEIDLERDGSLPRDEFSL